MTWLGFLGLLKRVPPAAWVVIAAAIALWAWGNHREAEGQCKEHAVLIAYQAKVIGATAIAKQHARAEEARQRAAFAEIGVNYLEAKDEANRKGRELADAVRAGRVRLRDHWTCPAGLPGAAGPAESADALADLRAAAAGRIVRIGAEADAQVKGLQDLLKAERARPIAR